MKGTVPTEADQAEDTTKLVPEWGRDGDHQIVLIGLAVVAAMALTLAALALTDRAEDSPVGARPSPAQSIEELGAAREAAAGEAAAATTIAPEPDGTIVVPVPELDRSVIDGVGEAMESLPGAIEVAAEGSTIVLTGFVANDAERRRAGQAAAAVDGVGEVDNGLILLEPEVTRVLTERGVAGATAVGRGTSITVSGTVASADQRVAALAGAGTVDGVTEVIDDRLNLEVVTSLNALPQVDFATGSWQIPASARADLDRAAQLLRAAGPISIEIRGYTDTVGSGAQNLRLGQARAEAVENYLVERGVGEAMLTATGFGETDQFGQDPSANRVVRFWEIDP